MPCVPKCSYGTTGDMQDDFGGTKMNNFISLIFILTCVKNYTHETYDFPYID